MPISAKQTAQKAAQAVAKQASYETGEFLKSAREQVMTPPETPRQDENKKQEAPQEQKEDSTNKRHVSYLESYQQELEQIRRENLYKELLKKVTEGEVVPLEDYAKELSFEQRQVLKAQMEAVKARREQTEQEQSTNSLPQIISKQGRRMFNKLKKQNEMHVETRQPPSS
jgi:hypothetical protein